jgi:protoporphyrinogen oxidase
VAAVWKEESHWVLESASGERRTASSIVSTIPIHELLSIWRDAPQAARDAAARLRYNSLINVLIGCDEDRGFPYTAIYVPDPDVLFHRISFPKNFSERTVPHGQSALMAEVTANEGDGVWEMSDDDILERCFSSLEHMGFLDRRHVTYRRVVRFPYGYPVYDLDYRKNVTVLRHAVEAAGVRLLGRFAQFDYINSDVCVERAVSLASELSHA